MGIGGRTREAAALRRRGAAAKPLARPGALFSRYSQSSGRADRASPPFCIPNFSGSPLSSLRLLPSIRLHYDRDTEWKHTAEQDQPGKAASQSSNSGLGEQKPTSEKEPGSRGAERKPEQASEETASAWNLSRSRAPCGSSAPISLGPLHCALGFISSGLRATSSGEYAARVDLAHLGLDGLRVGGDGKWAKPGTRAVLGAQAARGASG